MLARRPNGAASPGAARSFEPWEACSSCQFRGGPLAVDTAGGPAWGMTVADLREAASTGGGVAPGFSPWQVALEVDVDRFRSGVRRMLA